jgi:hypothetical protein
MLNDRDHLEKITYVTVDNKQYDLTTHFALLSETDVNNATLARWTSPTVQQDKHTVGSPTYNARLLAMVITNSITDDFLTTLIHRVPSDLCNDGTYLLWSVCHNIHRNNVAFHENIRNKICKATLSTYDNDIDRYINAIKNYHKMITPLSGSTSAETGLLTYILKQLKLCPVSLFQDYIRKIHVAFQEGEHSTMTPTSLLQQVEDKIRALKHASEWTTSEQQNPSAMALVASHAPPTGLEALLQQQTTLISKLLELHSKDTKQLSYHDWKHKAPANINDIQRSNGKIFRWCTKCNSGKGQWASAHDYTTHIDNFRNDRSCSGNGISNNGKHNRQGNLLRRGTAMLAQQDSSNLADDQSGSAPGINQAGLDSMAAHAARVRFTDNMEAGWRFDDVSDALDNPFKFV